MRNNLSMDREFVDLYTLQRDLKEGLSDLFPDRVWVKAEIASLSVKSGGHCYLDLVQSERGTVVARVRAIIWSSYHSLLNAKFRSATGSDIAAGTEILARAMVNFHEVYGLSLIIDDIDATLAVGEQQLKRRQTVERLTREGLLERQKGLRLAELPYLLAVISAEGAAGLQDFRTHLLQNTWGYAYRIDFYPAVMQGEDAPGSMISALQDIEAAGVRYDAVLILRGGGSDMDLVCFDDYGLAAAIARFPMPVVTAVGHDKDFHVADMVAFDHVKTPTALADMFLALTEAADARISAYENRLALAFRSRVAALETRIDLAVKGIQGAVKQRLAGAEYRVAMLEQKIAATDPRNVLRRGFSLALDSRGVKLTGVADTRPGDMIAVMFADGRISARVENVLPGGEAPQK